MITSAGADWESAPALPSCEGLGWGKIMTVGKIVLILWVLAAALGLFLAIHFSGHASLILEKCLALSLTHAVGG
jgi:hypothetical protein